MFKKKNPVKKVEVKHDEDSFKTHEIKINIKPLVTIEKHESRVNGKVQAPEFRISIGGRDVIMVNSREYKELFSEMLYRMDNDEIMHALYEKHAIEHAEVGEFEKHIGRMLEKVNFGELLKELTDK